MQTRHYLLLSLLASSAAVGTASAATVLRSEYQNGGNACTGALPAFEGALRKRPQAIVNEGTISAFATCSTPSQEFASKAKKAYLQAENTSGITVSMTCTLVVGAQWEGADFFPLTLVVPSNSYVQFGWVPANAAEFFSKRTINFSCALPQGVGVSYFGKYYDEEIGSP